MGRTRQQFIGSVIVAILYAVSPPIPLNMSTHVYTPFDYIQICFGVGTLSCWRKPLFQGSGLGLQVDSSTNMGWRSKHCINSWPHGSSLRFAIIHKRILQLHDFPHSHRNLPDTRKYPCSSLWISLYLLIDRPVGRR
jgi:hypothetical protein